MASSPVKKVLAKFAPPLASHADSDEPSTNFVTSPTSPTDERAKRRSTSLSPVSTSTGDEKPRKSSTFSNIMNTIRKGRSASRGSSLADHEAPENVPVNGTTNGHAEPGVAATAQTRGTQSRRLSMTEQREARKTEREEKEEEEAEQRRRRHRQAWQQDPVKHNYGDLPINQSQDSAYHTTHPSHKKIPKLTPLSEVASLDVGTVVSFRARIHHIRPLGSKIVFLVFRQGLETVQGVLTETTSKHGSEPNGPATENGSAQISEEESFPDFEISENMVRWSEGLAREAIVRVVGVIQHPPEEEGQHEVKSASVKEKEVRIGMIHVVSHPTAPLPFQVDDISRPLEIQDKSHHRVGEKTRFANRVLDLRSPASQAIFRIHAGVCDIFRTTLTSKGFTEIQSSKFQGGGTESGAAVFKVDYFRRPAFLAQSPQLAKQMCIAADMEKVFEIGPVFRAENSNTHRHLTEFTGMDLEMAFEEDYHEVMHVIDDTLKSIFKGLQDRFAREIASVKQVFPHDDLVVLDETPVIRYQDGIQMLRDAGYKEESEHGEGRELTDDEDLSTPAERKLGELVKEKYGADYYILDKFPTDVRPFYTMPDPENPKFSNSFDIFVRGEEILSGGQRIHHAPMLLERMKTAKVDPDTMADYINGFQWGCPPHGGGGIGLERIVMLFLKLGDVRWASLFPRDPRSFPMNGQDSAEAIMKAATAMILNGPESKTFEVGKGRGELPPLENLIAKYGDATNTSWVDPAWTVWRDDVTGAAVGYMPQGHFAVTFGNPLCEPNQIPRVVKQYLAYLAQPSINLRPIWCCIDKVTERYLSEELGWSAVVAVAEERVNPMEVDPVAEDKTVRRKVHRAERDGVKLHEVSGEPEPELIKNIEERCKEWAENRKGTQIHLTGVRPFDDMQHRRYFYATDKDGKICAMVVLAQLAPIHGFQIKWALEFPDAPLGAIEYILSWVIKKLGDAGVRSATFGAGAAARVEAGDNVGGFRFKFLEKTYNGLSSTFHLGTKGDFRGKFGIEQDPLFIAYPKGSLGIRGVEAIMAALQKPK
ncbi:aspartyl-tRNA synthetase, cytoplasmic [Trametopsis cervina]|nr:aspartyl-tRNA synthetase, cytoplasmic [Trametopsis cervina]